jgi:hypothetical protein
VDFATLSTTSRTSNSIRAKGAQMTETTSTTLAARLGDQTNMLTVEQVAAVVAGNHVIGEACDALKNAGCHARIAGNRITINDEMFAQFLGATVGPLGNTGATWVIYRTSGAPPVWVVGAEPQS